MASFTKQQIIDLISQWEAQKEQYPETTPIEFAVEITSNAAEVQDEISVTSKPKSEYQNFLARFRSENPDIKGKAVMVEGAKAWKEWKEIFGAPKVQEKKRALSKYQMFLSIWRKKNPEVRGTAVMKMGALDWAEAKRVVEVGGVLDKDYVAVFF